MSVIWERTPQRQRRTCQTCGIDILSRSPFCRSCCEAVGKRETPACTCTAYEGAYAYICPVHAPGATLRLLIEAMGGEV